MALRATQVDEEPQGSVPSRDRQGAVAYGTVTSAHVADSSKESHGPAGHQC
jgi:hypothetical protein